MTEPTPTNPSPAPSPAPSPTPSPAPVVASNPTPTPSQAPERPEWLPETFFDAKDGIKGKELRAEFDKLTAFKLEQDARYAAALDAPEKYQALLPSDFKHPESGKFEIDAKDPSFIGLQQLAHTMKWDQPTFSKALSLYAQNRIAETAFYADLQKKEVEKLGANGAARVDAVGKWLTARVGEDAAKVIMARPAIAKEIEAFESLMSAFGNVTPFNQQHRERPTNQLSEEQYNALPLIERRARLVGNQSTGS